MSPNFDAYVAGLMDGEGCLSVTGNLRRRSYTVAIELGMTKPALPLLERVQAQMGGRLRLTRAATEKWAEAWHLSWYSQDAADLAARLLPWLELKREHAQLILAFWRLRSECLTGENEQRAQWTAPALRRAEAMWARSRELNAKGPREPEPSEGWIARLVGGTWVTPQSSMFDDLGWEPFSGPWPSWGTWRDGAVYELPTSEHRIVVPDGSALLGTPTSHERTHSPRQVHHGIQLANQVAMLPTPAARDGGDRGTCSPEHAARRVANPERSVDLDVAVALLGTPTARDWKGSGLAHQLPTDIALLPTPTAQDSAGARNPTHRRPPGSTANIGDTLTDATQVLTGVRTRQRSDDGNGSPDDQLPGQLTLEDD